MNESFITIIMAAGKGKRMKSDLPKVIHLLSGKPLVQYVIDVARRMGCRRILLVVGHKKELVMEAIRDQDVEWVVQQLPLGTGDAVRSCRSALEGYSGDVLILSGDVPLLRPETIQQAHNLHRERSAVATLFTFEPDDPAGYGRIVRGKNGELLEIVEQKDATEDQLKIREVNTGIYLFDKKTLFETLDQIDNHNASGEYYLTDTISVLQRRNAPMAAYLVADPIETAGVNSQEQLNELERILAQRSVD